MAETTRLITELILKDDFTKKANTATTASSNLTQQLQKLKQTAGGLSTGMSGGFDGAAGIVGLRGLFASPKLMAGIGAFGAFGLNSFIRNIASGGGVIASMLSFLPRLVSTVLSVVSVFSLLITKFNLFIALGFQLLRIPFEILGSVLNLVGQGVEKLIAFLGQFAEKVAEVIGAVVGAIASMLSQLSMSAINTSNVFDSLRRTMAGFLGGREAGMQGARFLQQYGLTSPFEQLPIFETARVLLTIGLKLDRFLPVVERLALFAGGTPEALREVVDLLMRAVGGQTGLVFGPRGLGRFGISRDLLTQAGARFDKLGQFEGTPEDAIRVFEKLSELPFIVSIADFMRESNAVAFSNALDAISAILIEIGDRLNSFIVPLLRKASETILNLVRGGFVESLFQMVSKVFSPNIGDGWGLLESIIKNIAASLLSVVDIVKLLFANIPTIIKSAFDLLIGYAENALMFILYKIKQATIDFITWTLKFLPFGENLRESLRSLVAEPEYVDTSGRLQALIDSLSGLGAEISSVFDENKRAVDAMIEAGKTITQGVEDPSQQRVITGFDELIETSKNIEQNTREMVDMQKHILGGGDIGRLGITPLEMRNLNRRININVNANDSEVMRFLLPIIRDAIMQYEKQRAIGFQR